MRDTLFPLSVAGVCIFVAGCVNQPLLLRNRPNVPPPLVAPSPNGDESIDVNVDVVGDTTPAATLPVPVIKTQPITYKVVKGDSFWRISRKYGVDKNELAACNNLSLDRPLKIGVVLLIPPGGGAVAPGKLANHPYRKASRKDSLSNNATDVYATDSHDGSYVVRPGDSIWKIARKNGVTTKALVGANGLDPRKPIKPGMKLIIPGGVKAAAKPQDAPVNDASMNSTSKPDASLERTPEAVAPIKPDPSGADDLLDDAVKAADTSDKTSSGKKSVDEVLDELNSDSVNESSVEVPGAPYTEEVIPNETLQEIADRHGCTVEEILKANPNLKSEDDVKPFTSIIIPKK